MANNNRSAPASPSTRKSNTREPKPTSSSNFFSISFKFFQDNDANGQSIADWHDSGLLPALFEKLVHISKTDTTTLQTQGSITNYRKFPEAGNTDFRCPPSLRDDDSWAVIRNIGGQKARVAGFLECGVFYVVYLDKNHKFWKSER